MNLAVIQYNAGNIRSVLFALDRLGVKADLTGDPDRIRRADKVIFPGVGEANTTMRFLREKGLDEVIRSLRQPVLGICLGMQLLCDHSEENDTECLGIIPQHVRLFRPQSGEKVPHMGWNTLELSPDSWLGSDLQDQFVYFVHSYYVEPGPYTAASTHYVQPFSSVVRKDNFYATQFHPEKSGKVGEAILRTFLDI
ncbi:MAG TPA: imidazole glycerol phosphate synthase subunit HisH [Flavilitoribacter sp.]|nr:imidazole glycerol phosphate synthase subunit HisH [Flavilitoribacter sp.]HMQ87325.1 imidazole glycerol phosphate synthase subunit HisH [Flavilitoribacter sp.]